MSCHVVSRHVMSCHGISRLVISCHHVMSSHVLSRLVMSRHVTSCHVMSRRVTCDTYTCHVAASHVLSYHVIMSRIFLPSLLNSSIMAAGWPRRGFRNRGPVRESGSERRSRCGAACMQRSRGRLRGSGVFEACRGCVAALCRGDWVPGAFCTRMVNVRFAWQAAGIVRAGRCVAGMPRACWRRSAVGIGFRARRTRA